MNTTNQFAFKRLCAVLCALTLFFAVLPMGAVPAFATEDGQGDGPESPPPATTPAPAPSDPGDPWATPEPTPEPTPTPDDGQGGGEREGVAGKPVELDENGNVIDPDAEPTEEGEAAEGEEEALEHADESKWIYPPAWAGNAKQYLKGNILLSSEVRALDIMLDKQIARKLTTPGYEEAEVIVQGEDNLCAVFMIYAMLNDMTENLPMGIEINTEAQLEQLHQIFFDLNTVELRPADAENQAPAIVVTRAGLRDAVLLYPFLTDEILQMLQWINEDMRNMLEECKEQSVLDRLDDDEFFEIYESLPITSGERRAVVLAALSLKGKIKYFWGGKSYGIGWDNRWGKMRTVSTKGSPSYGTYRPLGMDCSGFVVWSFINSAGDSGVLSYVGSGSANQWKNSKEITWEEAMPGDLVFLQRPSAPGINHVGIVTGTDEDGNLLAVHCSGSANTVVVTDCDMFRYIRRPYVFADTKVDPA